MYNNQFKYVGELKCVIISLCSVDAFAQYWCVITALPTFNI